MVTATREALSVNSVTKADVLKLIPRQFISPVFWIRHYNREVVIGTIGDRGGGKSGSDAVLAMTDFMLMGKPVWSNMDIGADIEINDDAARQFGLKGGGVASFHSQPLEKDALLGLDERYRNGCLVIEEINVQYSNVRRFMTNTNVEFNEVCQQLRKFRTSLIYNVIDEMFIDPQLRALTDIFIRTYDTGFDIDARSVRKPLGVDFSWRVYPMSGYLAGEQGRYAITKKPLDRIYLHFAPWRGIYDSMQHQEKGKYSTTKKEREASLKANITADSSPEMEREMAEWRWLIERVRQWRQDGIKTLSSSQLVQMLGRPITRAIREALPVWGVTWDNYNQCYAVSSYRVEDNAPSPAKVLT